MTQIMQDILKLSVPERIIIVESIWDSIAANEEQLEISTEAKHLLDQRLKAHIDKPKEGSSWSEVKGRIKKHQ